MESTGRTVGGVAAFVGLAASVTGVVLAVGTDDVAAAGLERFASCAELEAWAAETAPESEGLGRETLAEEVVSEDAASADSAAGGDDGTGGTNTVVAGVDEVDVVDRIGDDRLLVARNGALSLVDLDGRAVVDHVEGLPWDARVSVDGDLVWVAGGSADGMGTEVLRVRLDGDQLVTDASWTTPGYLLDARRTGDRLHVVTVDHGGGGAVPFEDGPVPCDQVWRPTDPVTTPAATLVATLPADGELTPTAAVEVTGAAGNLLVTDDSVFVATETWTPDGSGVATGLHRFTLDGLQLTGSSEVPGILAGPFALHEHDGHLRVATSAPSRRGVIMEGDDVIGAPEPIAQPVPQEGEALAEIFVLDAGSLSLVGSTGRFGHDGETIHGVRFVGDVAYVVTFLQTDPFWVLDLSVPSAPRVVGELEIPGFSAYLHPVGDGRVVGFGPGGDGGMVARLFDATDPADPRLLDELALGDDTPVAWDRHAYVALDGGRFAVPVTDYAEVVCTSVDEPLPTEPAPDQPVSSPEVCETSSGGTTGVVVLAVDGADLVEVDREEVDSGDQGYAAERVVPTPDGAWLLLVWDRLLRTDGGPPILLPGDPDAGGGTVIID